MQAEEMVPGNAPLWIVGNSLNVIPSEEYDFVFTCPPYFDKEVYSDDSEDLSNYGDYSDFLEDYRGIIQSSIDHLKENRFACIVVGDIRGRDGLYHNFVSDTIAAFQDAGAALYNEAILSTPIGTVMMQVSRNFPVGRKLGKTHQNVLVFVKGDWRKAVEQCGPVKIATLELT